MCVPFFVQSGIDSKNMELLMPWTLRIIFLAVRFVCFSIESGSSQNGENGWSRRGKFVVVPVWGSSKHVAKSLVLPDDAIKIYSRRQAGRVCSVIIFFACYRYDTIQRLATVSMRRNQCTTTLPKWRSSTTKTLECIINVLYSTTSLSSSWIMGLWCCLRSNDFGMATQQRQ